MWVETRDAATPPAVHRTAPQQNDPVHNASSTDLRKPWCTMEGRGTCLGTWSPDAELENK